ncbi:MAG: hypothetical protein U9Q37_00920 [Euryarchaeota archaeon]|nr:hypothetical protein [Euryarchaeota archaeon]
MIKNGFSGTFFKPKEDDPWKQFSREIDAEYRSWWNGTEVVANVKNRAITFHSIYNVGDDDFLSNRDIVSASYLSKDGFQFNIYRKGVFSKIGELLGMRMNMDVGYLEFERDFIIKSNNEFKVRALLANPIIRQLIIQSLTTTGGFSLNRDELKLVSKIGSGVAQLRSFYKLFEETLNHLSDTGSTCETELPGTE